MRTAFKATMHNGYNVQWNQWTAITMNNDNNDNEQW